MTWALTKLASYALPTNDSTSKLDLQNQLLWRLEASIFSLFQAGNADR